MKNEPEVFSNRKLDELLFGRGMSIHDYFIEQCSSGEVLCFHDSEGRAFHLHFNDDDMAAAQMQRLKQLGVRMVTRG